YCGYAGLRIPHRRDRTASLGSPVLVGQTQYRPRRNARPPRALGHSDGCDRILDALAEPILGETFTYMAAFRFHHLFSAGSPSFTDRHTLARPTVAHRCWAESGSRIGYIRSVSTGAAPDLHIDVMPTYRNRLLDHAGSDASAFDSCVPRRH